MTSDPKPITIAANERERVDLGGLGIVWKIDGAEAGERFSVVHIPSPRKLSPRRSTSTHGKTSTRTSSRGRSGRSSATTSSQRPRHLRFGDLCARYGLDTDPDSVPGLCERFGLTM